MDTIRSKLLPWADSLFVSPLFSGRFEFLAHRAVNILLIWQERATQRHALAALEARLLRDMGLSCADARREAAKPFWRA